MQNACYSFQDERGRFNVRLRVPARVFILVIKQEVDFQRMVILGRFSCSVVGFPFAFGAVSLVERDCWTFFLVKSRIRSIQRELYKKYFFLLAGYYKQVFGSRLRGTRQTIYQYGLGFKSYFYPCQNLLLFKVGRGLRTYYKVPDSVYLLQTLKRHRRLVRFTPSFEEMRNFLCGMSKLKPASKYRPRKGVFFRGKFYFLKKSGKLLSKGKKK